MSHPGGSSLLDFVDSPVIVGDPDSRVIYVNPSCESRLGIVGDVARGETLSSLFEGGSRESVLKAVAEVCTSGRTVHFKLREAGSDYLAQASPIEAEGDRVGVVILLTDEPAASSPIEILPARLAEPLDETIACLQELAASADATQSDVIERGLAGLVQLQKLASAPSVKQPVADIDPSDEESLDPVLVARQVARRIEQEHTSGAPDLDLLVPLQLPAARGDADGVEAALMELVRHGIRQAGGSGHLTLSARVIGGLGRQSLLFSVVQLCDKSPSEGQGVASEPAPHAIREQVEELGGSLFAATSESLGRVTSIQLRLVD